MVFSTADLRSSRFFPAHMWKYFTDVSNPFTWAASGSESMTSFKILFSEHLVHRLWGQCAPNGILEFAFPERSQISLKKRSW